MFWFGISYSASRQVACSVPTWSILLCRSCSGFGRRGRRRLGSGTSVAPTRTCIIAQWAENWVGRTADEWFCYSTWVGEPAMPYRPNFVMRPASKEPATSPAIKNSGAMVSVAPRLVLTCSRRVALMLLVRRVRASIRALLGSRRLSLFRHLASSQNLATLHHLQLNRN